MATVMLADEPDIGTGDDPRAALAALGSRELGGGGERGTAGLGLRLVVDTTTADGYAFQSLTTAAMSGREGGLKGQVSRSL